MDTPLTVAELIAKLQTLNQDALVMLECEDHYYSGPLTNSETFDSAVASHCGAFDWEDGKFFDFDTKPFKPRIRHVKDRWLILEKDCIGQYSRHPVLERKPCIIINVS